MSLSLFRHRIVRKNAANEIKTLTLFLLAESLEASAQRVNELGNDVVNESSRFVSLTLPGEHPSITLITKKTQLVKAEQRAKVVDTDVFVDSLFDEFLEFNPAALPPMRAKQLNLLFNG